jgi:hypothetical protein
MHRRANFAHGHSGEKLSYAFWGRKRSLFHFNHDPGAFAFPGMIDDRVLRERMATLGAATTTVGIPGEAELRTLKPAAKQQSRGDAHDSQRNQLLPVHGRKITSKRSGATNVLNGPNIRAVADRF